MAKPAFIYAFDNLGPERFTELCGLLLASRHKGFLLGGVGPDGGVDAELDDALGLWQPESEAALLTEIIRPGQVVVFQFKHKVTARVGQVESRKQLLNLYKCRRSKKCELHRSLIIGKNPAAYVLVTNVEVNSEFRSTFIKHCQNENSNIKHYQVIGLDELETWITSEVELRHLYFPTIFGSPRFNLQVRLNPGFTVGGMGESVDILSVTVLNVGAATSYINSVDFKLISGGEVKKAFFFQPTHPIMMLNPKPGLALEPGRKQDYLFPFDLLRDVKDEGKPVFFVEVVVKDELDNEYRAPITDNLREFLKSRR